MIYHNIVSMSHCKIIMSNHNIIMSENDDWKQIIIEPPAATKIPSKDLVKITDMPMFTRKAFGYTKALN